MRYKVRAVNDDRDFCQCCGKRSLKKVVWIEDVETSEIRHFGTTCAMSPSKGFGLEAEIKKAIYKHKKKEAAVISFAHQLYRRSGGKIVGNAIDGWRAADCELFDACRRRAVELYG